MTFSSTIVGRPQPQLSGKLMSWGTWDGGSEHTGNINTGLRSCDMIMLTPNGAAVAANAPTSNETFPCTGSAVTIYCGADIDGYWLAIGD